VEEGVDQILDALVSNKVVFLGEIPSKVVAISGVSVISDTLMTLVDTRAIEVARSVREQVFDYIKSLPKPELDKATSSVLGQAVSMSEMLFGYLFSAGVVVGQDGSTNEFTVFHSERGVDDQIATYLLQGFVGDLVLSVPETQVLTVEEFDNMLDEEESF